MAAASALVTFATIYAAIGVLFACAFVARGAAAIDAHARGGNGDGDENSGISAPGIGFRIAIFPGSAALWPALLVLWLRTPATSKPAPSGSPGSTAHQDPQP